MEFDQLADLELRVQQFLSPIAVGAERKQRSEFLRSAASAKKGFYRPQTAYLADTFPPSSHVFEFKHSFLRPVHARYSLKN